MTARPTKSVVHIASGNHSNCDDGGVGQSACDVHRTAADLETLGADHSRSADLCNRVGPKPFDLAISDASTAVPPPNQTHHPANEAATSLIDAPGAGDGQSGYDALRTNAVALLIELWRQRQDLRRAQGRLDLQCQAICRRSVDGDKAAAAVLWRAIKSGEGDLGLTVVLAPYIAAIDSLELSAVAIEKQIVKLARTLPLWLVWAKSVKGMAELSFAGMVGEAGRTPGEYRSVAALWKRFGLAVINGGRQRLIAGAEAAALHGYAPQRRAYAYTLSTNLMRSQGEEGPYRAVYDERKAYELARDIPKAHAHNRALRYMVKRLLRDAWRADRHAMGLSYAEHSV